MPSLSLFEKEKASFKARALRRKRRQKVVARRERKEEAGFEAAIRRIPAVIAELERNDPAFKRYMARAEKVDRRIKESPKYMLHSPRVTKKDVARWNALSPEEQKRRSRKWFEKFKKALQNPAPKPEKTAVILASYQFPAERYSRFTGHMSRGEDTVAILLVREGEETWVGVYKYIYDRTGYVWQEEHAREHAKVAKDLRRLSNPATALKALFAHRSPK